MAVQQAERVKVWDPVLRIFHWSLATLVIVNWLLGKFGPTVKTYHFWIGYTILGLVIFRIIWGIIGPNPARFVNFLRGPKATLAYMRHIPRRQPSLSPGHNPMGALSVVAILLVLLWQVGSGLVMDPDDFINVGPLADQVSRDINRAALGWHDLGSDVIFALVVLHIAAIAFYRIWKREDLVRPMITGWKWVRKG
jgi:cytochrome b